MEKMIVKETKYAAELWEKQKGLCKYKKEEKK